MPHPAAAARILEQPSGYGYLVKQATDECLAVLGDHRDHLVTAISEDFAGGDSGAHRRALRIICGLRLAGFLAETLRIYDAADDLRFLATCALRDAGDTRAIAALVERHPDLKGSVAFDVLRYLQAGRPADPLLVERLGSDDPITRSRAASSLAESGDPALIPHVARLVRDADPDVRQGAANMGLCMRGEDLAAVRPHLLPLLADPEPRVKRFVATSLAHRRDPACAPVLLELLKDGSMEECWHSNVVQAMHTLTGSYFGYHIGSDGWHPSTPKNREAIARFETWIVEHTAKP